MLSFIAFGIVVVVAVALLLAYNLRAFNRTETIQETPPKETDSLSEVINDKELETSPKNPEEPVPNLKEKSLAQMSDQQYRNALRQNLGEKKETVTPSEKRRDEEYRSALRSMRSPKG
ncbi:hypothetical protein [Desulfosporosinus sp. FKB]|uniref:hypothetical protein n=1 Tax=Desulfosporosinus sp. FKB TaxID=1969835 RepID=UPI000B49FDEA|nr:hypothetical protein [Desulfosporosinus sp. FKB]